MKRVHQILFSFFFALCCVSSAYAASDLSARLQAEIDGFKQEIESSRGPQLITVADRLTGTGLSDPALQTVVETKTKLLISEHEVNPKDKTIAEELNSMIRALGSMGTGSRDLIAGLVNSSKSRGVRERALRLPAQMDWYVKRNALMQKPDFYQPGQDLMTHRYLNLLASGDSAMGRWGLEELDRRRGAEPVVYAKMREILAQEKSAIKDAVHLDYLAWICKLLGRYDAANSKELLQSIQNDPREDKFFKKLKKYAKV